MAGLQAEENLNALAVQNVPYLEEEDRTELVESWQDVAGIEQVEGPSPQSDRISFEDFKAEIKRPI